MNQRSGFTLVDGMVAGGVSLVLIALVFQLMMRIPKPLNSETTAVSPSAAWGMQTVTHDNHLWVESIHHFVHHPDCPCSKRQAEANISE